MKQSAIRSKRVILRSSNGGSYVKIIGNKLPTKWGKPDHVNIEKMELAFKKFGPYVSEVYNVPHIEYNEEVIPNTRGVINAVENVEKELRDLRKDNQELYLPALLLIANATHSSASFIGISGLVQKLRSLDMFVRSMITGRRKNYNAEYKKEMTATKGLLKLLREHGINKITFFKPVRDRISHAIRGVGEAFFSSAYLAMSMNTYQHSQGLESPLITVINSLFVGTLFIISAIDLKQAIFGDSIDTRKDH